MKPRSIVPWCRSWSRFHLFSEFQSHRFSSLRCWSFSSSFEFHHSSLCTVLSLKSSMIASFEVVVWACSFIATVHWNVCCSIGGALGRIHLRNLHDPGQCWAVLRVWSSCLLHSIVIRWCLIWEGFLDSEYCRRLNSRVFSTQIGSFSIVWVIFLSFPFQNLPKWVLSVGHWFCPWRICFCPSDC